MLQRLSTLPLPGTTQQCQPDELPGNEASHGTGSSAAFSIQLVLLPLGPTAGSVAHAAQLQDAVQHAVLQGCTSWVGQTTQPISGWCFPLQLVKVLEQPISQGA